MGDLASAWGADCVLNEAVVGAVLRDPENLPAALRNFDGVFEARDV